MAAGPVDRRDSVGVSIDGKTEEESLQRDGAVCISTNGEFFSANQGRPRAKRDFGQASTGEEGRSTSNTKNNTKTF